MATYKKRGYKPKTKAEKIEAIEENSTTAEVFNTLDESASKAEEWVVKNQKYIFGIVGAIAVVVLGYMAYANYVLEPNNQKAMNDMFTAQQYYFQADTSTQSDSLYNLSLNGGGGKFGMLDIIEEYSGTPAANLASYYAGTAYLNTKNYQEAINHLGNFSSDDKMLGAIAKGGIGDAFVQLNQPNEALEYYEKAITINANDYTTPMYLLKAATLEMSLENNSKALTYLKRIKEDFEYSTEATNIEVLIGKAEASL